MTKATYKPAITKDTPYPKETPLEFDLFSRIDQLEADYNVDDSDENDSTGNQDEEDENSSTGTHDEEDEDILAEYPNNAINRMQAISAIQLEQLEDLTPDKNFLSDPEKHFPALIQAHLANHKAENGSRVSCDSFSEYMTDVFSSYYEQAAEKFGEAYTKHFDPEYYYRIDQMDESEKDI